MRISVDQIDQHPPNLTSQPWWRTGIGKQPGSRTVQAMRLSPEPPWWAAYQSGGWGWSGLKLVVVKQSTPSLTVDRHLSSQINEKSQGVVIHIKGTHLEASLRLNWNLIHDWLKFGWPRRKKILGGSEASSVMIELMALKAFLPSGRAGWTARLVASYATIATSHYNLCDGWLLEPCSTSPTCHWSLLCPVWWDVSSLHLLTSGYAFTCLLHLHPWPTKFYWSIN